ncbi:MAG: hypothetical protein KJ066_23140 [Acidobacteria bacterium]|nr:hypothetical protein [Acidobacteriota bacterium]
MTRNETIVSALRQRLPLLEDLRRRARSVAWRRAAGCLVLGVLFLAALAGTAVGSLWVLGNFVTQSLWIVVPLMLASVVAVVVLFVGAFKAAARWGEDVERQYVTTFRNQVVLPTLDEGLPGCTPSADGLIDIATFDASALFSSHHDHRLFESHYGLTGQVQGAAFRGSMVRARKHVHSRQNRQHQPDVTVFKGIFFHVDHPVDVPGTVRLVDDHLYPGADRPEWGIVRREHTVRVQSGVDAFDREALAVVDKDQEVIPPMPEAAFHAWPEVRALIDRPVFASFNATGLYLSVAISSGDRFPLEERLNTANRAEELADDIALIERVVRALDMLRRALT